MKRNLCLSLIGAMLVSTVLMGCGGSSSKSSDSYNAAATSEAYASYDMAEEAAYYEDDIYEYEANMGESSDGLSVASDDDLASNSNRKLIRTVNMSVETREFDELIVTVENKIAQLGGYAQSKDINGNSYDSNSRRSAYIVARIPANNLDSFVTGIEEKSNITQKNESAEDVTLSYADVEARRNSLRVEQERLNDLLAQADSLETIIALESRLTEVRYELESYESRLRTMDNQVQYSTVNLSVSEVKEYKPEPVEDPTFGERLKEEFSESFDDAFEAIQDFVIGLIAFIPTFIVFVIILGVIGLIIFAIVKVIMLIVKKASAKSSANKILKAKNNKKDKATAVALSEPPVKGSSEAEVNKEVETDKN